MDQERYRKMYAILCGAASDAVDALQDPNSILYAKTILETALLKAENIYLDSEEDQDMSADTQP